MKTKIENLGILDTTYAELYVDNYKIKDNFQISLVLKATGWFKKYTLTELQEWRYERMYDELIHKLAEKGLI